ncbi:MAG: class D sortase [Clostridia bacterium]|nr:class D sortase [Clostridia bacterium]
MLKQYVNHNSTINELGINKVISETIKGNMINEHTKESTDWKIEIPKINLVANIAEGTEENTLNKYVGHFEETVKTLGNIGLAAHNRGYKVNYFEKIKELKKGDEIYYKYNEFQKVYVVQEEKIIKDTNWKVLENTKENYLTLITCLENRPEERRCIIAKEK